MTEMTVEAIMQERGITKVRAYKVPRELSAEANSVGASQSLADKILRILKNAPVKDVSALQQALFFVTEEQHATTNDITRAVWSLQKRNLVTFYERKLMGNSILSQIKLSRNGLRELGVVPSKEHLTPSYVKPSNELKRPSPVGKDMTEAKNQPAVTNGGPVETVQSARYPEVIPPVPRDINTSDARPAARRRAPADQPEVRDPQGLAGQPDEHPGAHQPSGPEGQVRGNG